MVNSGIMNLEVILSLLQSKIPRLDSFELLLNFKEIFKRT